MKIKEHAAKFTLTNSEDWEQLSGITYRGPNTEFYLWNETREETLFCIINDKDELIHMALIDENE